MTDNWLFYQITSIDNVNHLVYVFGNGNVFVNRIFSFNSNYPSLMRLELSKSKLTACIGGQLEEFCESEHFSAAGFQGIDLAGFWTTDKTLELFVVTGLWEEAICFARLVNDWKSSFLVSSILKEADQWGPDSETQAAGAERLLSVKLCAILGKSVFSWVI